MSKGQDFPGRAEAERLYRYYATAHRKAAKLRADLEREYRLRCQAVEPLEEALTRAIMEEKALYRKLDAIELIAEIRTSKGPK